MNEKNQKIYWIGDTLRLIAKASLTIYDSNFIDNFLDEGKEKTHTHTQKLGSFLNITNSYQIQGNNILFNRNQITASKW